MSAMPLLTVALVGVLFFAVSLTTEIIKAYVKEP